jgi:hypothetical protein
MTDYDSEAPILAFRRFRRLNPSLYVPAHSLAGSWRQEAWPTREPMVARCRAYSLNADCQGGPLSQGSGCMCGLHGFYSMQDALKYHTCSSMHGWVVAICAFGGRVLFDSLFLRASVADVVCIVDPMEYGPQIQRRGNYATGVYQEDITEDLKAWAIQTGERYGVPVLGLFDAMDLASEVGVFVDGVRDEDGKEIVEGIDD